MKPWITVLLMIACVCAGIMYACLAAISKKYSRAEEEEDLRMAAEKNFENKIKEYLHKQGCWVLKYWGGGGFTKSGVPDLLICCSSYFIAVEVKAENGRPSQLQLAELRKIRKSGGIAILLYPEDFDTFKRLIRAVQAEEHSIIRALTGHFEEKEKKYVEC